MLFNKKKRWKGNTEILQQVSLEKLLPAVLLNLLPVVAVNASARETMAVWGENYLLKEYLTFK